MTYEEQHRSVVRDRVPAAGSPVTTTEESVHDTHTVSPVRPTATTLVSRIVILVFGVIQALIVMRILFLLLDAREGNALVRAILDLSQIFVAPFEGMLRTNAIASGGAVLDVAALVALVGWTILELFVLAIVRIARPGNAV